MLPENPGSGRLVVRMFSPDTPGIVECGPYASMRSLARRYWSRARRLMGGIVVAVYEDRYCAKCKKKVRMTRCEVCKGTGGSGGIMPSQCRSGCNQHGWLCPTHGKNY